MSFHLFSSNHVIDIPKGKKTNEVFDPFTYEPKCVYVPITDNNRQYLDKVLRINDVVKKGKVIGREKVTNFPYYSPISGRIKEIVEMPFSDFTFRECYKIENDYLSEWDLESELTNPDSYSRGDIYNFIKNSGIVERDSNFKPIYKLFEPEFNIHTLIINAIEYNPYLGVENLFTANNIDYIYYVIPFLKRLSGINRFIICINPSQKVLESKIIASKKSYNDISFEIKKVDDAYPSFNSRNLVRNFSKERYNLVPQEIGYSVISLFSLEMLGRFLFEGKRPDLFCYDLVGEVKNPTFVIAPFGILASNIVNIIGQGTTYNEDNLLYLESDPISGLPHSNLNYILFPSSKGIIVTNKYKKKVYTCINCGRCIDVCPSDLIPVKIYKYSKKNNIKKLEKLDINKCSGCGNCSYVCPSNLELTSTCVNAKLKLKD